MARATVTQTLTPQDSVLGGFSIIRDTDSGLQWYLAHKKMPTP